MLIAALEAQRPGAVVLQQNGVPVRAGELATRARALAGALLGRGIGEGDRVLLLLPNCRELVLALAACARIGAIAAPLDPATTGDELGRALPALAPRAAFVLGRGYASLAQGIARAEVSPPLVVKIDADEEGLAQGIPTLGAFLEGAPREVPARPPERAEFLALPAWRGRGRPHFALLEGGAACQSALAFAKAAGLEAARMGGILGAAPFHRPQALLAHVLAPILLEIPVVVLKQLRARMAIQLAKLGAQAVLAPPALLGLMAKLAAASGDRLESVRVWISTGAPPPEAALVEAFEKQFRAPLVWGYGSPELPWATLVSGERRKLSPAARGVGDPIAPEVKVRIVEDGHEVSPGRPGWVFVSSPWAARELLGELPEDRAQPLGIPTGDRGAWTLDGALRIQGRDDVGTVAAYEVDLVEVAQALLEHPRVALAQAYAVPDPDTGAHVRAVVSLAPGAETSVAELVDFLRPRLSYWKLPQSFKLKHLERPE